MVPVRFCPLFNQIVFSGFMERNLEMTVWCIPEYNRDAGDESWKSFQVSERFKLHVFDRLDVQIAHLLCLCLWLLTRVDLFVKESMSPEQLIFCLL